MIERRRIWTDAVLADYIRDELGFPGARQGAMVEKETVDMEFCCLRGGRRESNNFAIVRLEGWFPPRMSMPLRAKSCAFRPTQTIRNHWSVENSLSYWG